MPTLPGFASHVASVGRDDSGKLYLVLNPRKGASGQERLVFGLTSGVDVIKATELVKDFNRSGSLLAGALPLAPDEVPKLR